MHCVNFVFLISVPSNFLKNIDLSFAEVLWFLPGRQLNSYNCFSRQSVLLFVCREWFHSVVVNLFAVYTKDLQFETGRRRGPLGGLHQGKKQIHRCKHKNKQNKNFSTPCSNSTKLQNVLVLVPKFLKGG